MAHFAEIDENNIVKRVIVIANEELLEDGVESEKRGIRFCQSLYGNDTRWVQTSYNGNFRKNYAGKGYYYDEQFKAFRPPKPYPSWKLDYETFRWLAPIPMPPNEEGYIWRWGEENQEWIKVVINNDN